MKSEFTGRHMLAILVAGFGIVVVVNFYMAYLATHGFGGVVVENSYVASQKYNEWLDEARRERAFGWQARIGRDEGGRLSVTTQGVPTGAEIVAELRRPLGDLDDAVIGLKSAAAGQYISPHAVPAGRWLVRLHIKADGRRMQAEDEIG